MKVSECCGARLLKYDKNWDDGICLECKEHSPAQKNPEKPETIPFLAPKTKGELEV